MKFLFLPCLFFFSFLTGQSKKEQPPMKVAVVGLVHTHVHWLLGREDRGDIQIVGIVESNKDLAQRYTKQHGFSMDIVYDSIEDMLEKTKPEAVYAFNTIYGHLEVVEKCAPKGIHVMVEKPLAVSLDHAEKMAALAQKHNIHLLTNYETTWYASNHSAKAMVEKGDIGELRKIVIHDGHPGPIEIGCNPEFTDWLTDPKWNGAGALTDFGCYGANQASWLLKNERPLEVFAVTQQIKPDMYPKVDDEATIVVTYPKAQVIIQASWNWPYNRKDIEIYGQTGYIHNLDGQNMRILLEEKEGAKNTTGKALENPYDDPFAYFTAVIRGEIKVAPSDLSALENNIIVMEILDAAMRSAKTGKKITLKK
jgi:predicted dehydrogenase